MANLISLYKHLFDSPEADPILSLLDAVSDISLNGTVIENYELMNNIKLQYTQFDTHRQETVDVINQILHFLYAELQLGDLEEEWRYCMDCGNFEDLICHGPFAGGRWFECPVCGHQFYFQGKTDVDSE